MKKETAVHFTDSTTEYLSLATKRKNELLPIKLAAQEPLATDGIKRVIEALNSGLTPVILGNENALNSWSKLKTIANIPADCVAIIATSGTSGEPKWVPISLQQLQTSVSGSPSNLLPTKDKAWLLSLPIHHTGGLAVLLRSALNGNDVVVSEGMSTSDISVCLKKIHQIQTLSLVPKQLSEFLRSTEELGLLLTNKQILLGGGPVSVELRQKIHQAKLSVFYSYGMSETFGQLFSVNAKDLNAAEIEQNLAGKISADNEFLIDENQHLLVKGPQIFTGYLSDEECNDLSQKAWFDTGDLAQINEYGNLEILMRRTDLIVSGGKNIRPQEVEQFIADSLKLSLDSFVVVGVEDPEWGEIIGLCIEEAALAELLPEITTNTNSDALVQIQQRLQEFLLEKLPKNLAPRKITFLTDLPRTDIGKIKRAEIKALMNV